MQTSTRPRPQPGGQHRPHGTQLSISDDSHHVTDAISSLYDNGEPQSSLRNEMPQGAESASEKPSTRSHRPLSFLPSAREEISHSLAEGQEDARNITSTKPLGRAKTLEGGIRNHARPSHHTNRQYVVGRSISAPHEPALQHLRSPADTATSSFPLNDIDYESSPAAVAQELSNLQAIRRMSMNVEAAGDPDLPSFGVQSLTPPQNDADADDASRLFWVPASLHPELAPKEFKTFLDSRVESLKRRSGEFNVPEDGPSRSNSSTGLRRKKSMLSRQIDNSEGRGAEGYQDGAERLDRKRSSSAKDTLAASGMANLHDLEVLVNDPATAMAKLSMDGKPDGQQQLDEDLPILPSAPGGLKRSTRTTYRRRSQRDRKQLPAYTRVAPSQRPSDQAWEEAIETSPPAGATEMPNLEPTRVQVEHIASTERHVADRPAENFSRPSRRPVGSPTSPPPSVSFDSGFTQQPKSPPDPSERKSPPPSAIPPQSAFPPSPVTSDREPKPFVSQIASNGRTTARLPSIAEPQVTDDLKRTPSQQDYKPPERVSSHQPIPFSQPQAPGVSQTPPPPGRSGKRAASIRTGQSNDQTSQTLQHMAAHPSPLPGNSTRTDSLSFIPTLTEDRKPESKKEPKKSGWGALGSWLGGDEKERERRREEEAREAREAEKANKRSKGKAGRPSDSGRLDVLQTTMDSSRGRESLVLDRGEVRLEEERKKESTRKSSESRKERDGLFGKVSGFFGDSKKRPEREGSGKKAVRPISPDPPRPALKPDVDYNWTRFSIIEERAIYRMAHIKLANPRRPLYSQVLLSNFMYSYLAKVQQMHPQIQIPQSAAAKAQQRAQQQKKTDQPEEYYQYQRYQEQIQEQERAEQAAAIAQDQNRQQGGATYVEDTQNYNYDHSDAGNGDKTGPHSAQQQNRDIINGDSQFEQGHGYGYHPQEQSPYQYQQSQFDDPGRTQDDDMW